MLTPGRITLVLITIVAVVAVIAGFVFKNRLNSGDIESQQLKAEIERLNEELEKVNATRGEALERAEADNEWLKAELEKLRKQPAQMNTLDRPAPPDAEPDESVDLAALFGQIEDSGPPREDRGERDQRRREWMENMRRNHDEFFENQIASAGSPEEAERLSAIRDYNQYMMELRGQLRNAETDEERAALWEDMQQAMQESHTLMDEQRQYMLENIAEEYGIKDQSKQQAFSEAVQEAVNSPYFRMGFGGGPPGGGGPGGGGGFPGGGGRRGGR